MITKDARLYLMAGDDNLIEIVSQLVKRSQYRLTLHARSEMDADGVFTEELQAALCADNCEVIEDYPEDPRGHSHLILAWIVKGGPLHVCCAVHEDELVIITVYRPSEHRWSEDWRQRK